MDIEWQPIFEGMKTDHCFIRPQDKSAYWKSIFFISYQKHMLWVQYSKEPSRRDGSFEHNKHMFKLMDKKIMAIVR